jgi:hypothetical protein
MHASQSTANRQVFFFDPKIQQGDPHYNNNNIAFCPKQVGVGRETPTVKSFFIIFEKRKKKNCTKRG